MATAPKQAPKQPEKLTPAQQEAVQNAKDAKARQQESKAPTTLTTMGQAFAKGGFVRAADGIAQRGKTKGKWV